MDLRVSYLEVERDCNFLLKASAGLPWDSWTSDGPCIGSIESKDMGFLLLQKSEVRHCRSVASNWRVKSDILMNVNCIMNEWNSFMPHKRLHWGIISHCIWYNWWHALQVNGTHPQVQQIFVISIFDFFPVCCCVCNSRGLFSISWGWSSRGLLRNEIPVVIQSQDTVYEQRLWMVAKLMRGGRNSYVHTLCTCTHVRLSIYK